MYAKPFVQALIVGNPHYSHVLPAATGKHERYNNNPIHMYYFGRCDKDFDIFLRKCCFNARI